MDILFTTLMHLLLGLGTVVAVAGMLLLVLGGVASTLLDGECAETRS